MAKHLSVTQVVNLNSICSNRVSLFFELLTEVLFIFATSPLLQVIFSWSNTTRVEMTFNKAEAGPAPQGGIPGPCPPK